jgi:DNA-binding transcriptional regulator YiaG
MKVPHRFKVGFDQRGQIQLALAGRTALAISRVWMPSASEARESVLRLRSTLGLPRGTLAALLGVGESTVRGWEKGRRHLCGPSKRLVWFLDILTSSPQRVSDTASFWLTWGKEGTTRPRVSTRLRGG